MSTCLIKIAILIGGLSLALYLEMEGYPALSAFVAIIAIALFYVGF